MNLGLRTTIGLAATFGLITVLGLFGWLASNALSHENDDQIKERLTVAYAAANYLDNTLKSIHALLDTAVDFESGLPSEPQFIVAERLIRDAFASYGVELMDVAVVDNSGQVVRDTPEQPELFGGLGYQAETYPSVAETLKRGDYTVSEVVFDPLTGSPAVLLVSPIFGTDGTIAGAIIAEISIKQLHLFFLDSPATPGNFSNVDGRGRSLGATGYVELVDASGVIIDRTSPGPSAEKNEKTDLSGEFVKLISEKRATIMTHKGPEKAPVERYFLAFVPLPSVPWGVVIWQSESEVRDATAWLRNQLIIYGIGFVIVTLALIWVGMRRVLNPISLLTNAARKVGEGNFDVSIPIKSRDEIGQLATAFRTMTGQLHQSRDTLSKLYQSEKEKQELRGRLLQDVVAAQEDERKRIARELHDELAQSMTVLIMRLELLENRAGAKYPTIKEDLTSAHEMAMHVLDSMRNLTFALRPLDLDVLGLVPATRAFIENRSNSGGAEIQFSVEGLDDRLSAPLETTLFRITQELIRNVDKHASAMNIRIRLERTVDKVQLIVEDDGKGFNPEDVSGASNKAKSFGLVGIRERVELLGGETKIESAPEKGTRVTVTIPLLG